VRTLKLVFSTALATSTWALPAAAITADVPNQDASLVGESYTFKTVVSDTTGTVLYRYSFGDDAQTDFMSGASEIAHTYTSPGHYPIIITVKDDAGFTGVSFVHTVHYPLLSGKPSVSTDLVYDQVRNRVYNINRDNDSVTVIDPIALTKLGEIAVYRNPEALALAPDGKLWVVHSDDHAMAVIDPDKLTVERGFRLPYASQPVGLVMSPTGDAAYVTLMAVGKLLKLNPKTGDVMGELEVGPRPRGVTVSYDAKHIYVTRFISADTGGEVVDVDGSTFTIAKRFALVTDTTTPDTDQAGRGLPNYVFSVGLSPDGRTAWVPAKKDNIYRGLFRDGKTLNQDNTTRTMVSIIDLAQGAEDLNLRIDFCNRGFATHVEFSPWGDYAFASVNGDNMVEIRDGYTGDFVSDLRDAGLAPTGMALGPKNRLFVNGTLSRSVAVYDVADLLTSVDKSSKKIAEIATVAHEKLDPQVLMGKQIFSNAADMRMTTEGYISCASCHFDGFEDGRVFDFSDQGEGLRNTPSLLGRRGMGEGNVHWSGNFDEIQDFESEIRDVFQGSGFMDDDVYNSGTHKDPLGDKKAGLSKELDALAAYVTTLDHVDPSPFRNPDGTMTADALAGKELFTKLGCDFCHVGPDFTDSVRGMLHDVGTIKASSGKRSGAPLLGIDTPTLLGIWETAPYLHDGSAPTLRDVLTTANPRDSHGFTSELTSAEIDQLVAFLQQLDNDLPPRRLPFEPNVSDAGQSDAEAGPADAAAPLLSPASGHSGCACEVSAHRDRRGIWSALAFAPLLALHGRRRGRTGRRPVTR
jgi:DNA-binding beta-propeller fold protein YncE/cytochrome c peroxidase